MLSRPRKIYKPFKYPWAYEYFIKQQQSLWSPFEVELGKDVHDWNNNLTEEEQNLVASIFRFFVQSDCDVASGYCEVYLPYFKVPEIRMMLLGFASMEAIHIQAYSHLIETLDFPEDEYSKFLNYQAMVDKHEYVLEQQLEGLNKPYNIAKNISLVSAFTEGIQLFSSFAILLSFPERGLLNGMGQIIAWSVRDETLHVEGMIRTFRELINENPVIWTDRFKRDIYQACRDMVKLEDAFIDLAFKNVSGIPLVSPDSLKLYIRWIANRRLNQLGLKSNWFIEDNPLPWVANHLNGDEHANFFEVRATEYSKNTLTGVWADAF